MSAGRKKIRNAIQALLLAELSGDVGTRIYQNRSAKSSDEFPRIFIKALGGPVKGVRESPRVLERSCGIEVEVHFRAETDIAAADGLDDLCEKIEQVIGRNRFLKDINGNRQTKNILLSEDELDQDHMDQPVHGAKLTFFAEYDSGFPSPDEDLQDLASVQTEFDHKPQTDDTPDMTGKVEIDQEE